MDAESILEGLKRFNVPHDEIAAAINRDRTVATKMLNGVRSMKAAEVEPLQRLLAKFESEAGELNPVRRPDGSDAAVLEYVEVEVLPTFAGLGGGGTGDADLERALISRRLVEEELRARPQDLLVINVRGTSMIPMFQHGDQLIVDRRDRSPTQAGPFAILYDDGYAVKNVAWVEKRKKLRISSANLEFPPEDFEPDEVQIIGRPVWFARRL